MKKVVSATLAGALAVGMVPAMALAEEGGELQATEWAGDFAGGSITAATDDENGAVDLTKAVKLTLDADGAYLVPTQVTTSSGTVINLADANVAADYEVEYYAVSGSTTAAWSGTDGVAALEPESDTWVPGSYYVIVYPSDLSSDNAVALKFTVESAVLSGLSVFEADADAADGGLSDTEFVYSGTDFAVADFGIAYGGKEFKDAEVTGFLPYGASASATAATTIDVEVSGLGKYYAVIEGKAGTEYEGAKTEALFEIVAYDLSKDPDLGIKDFENAATTPTVADILNIDLDDSLVTASNLSVVVEGLMKRGANEATISVVKKVDSGALEGFVVNSKTVTFKVVDDVLDAARPRSSTPTRWRSSSPATRATTLMPARTTSSTRPTTRSS